MNKELKIIDIVQQYIASENSFPVLNPQAIKLQNEIIKNDPDFDAVKKLIRTDPTLTSEILKIANSPFYKGLGEVETIRDALVRLGQNELINIVMRVIHKQNFSSANPMIKEFQKRLWNHSVACAIGTLWTTRYLKMEDLIPKAFISGLLHDMGKLCLLSALEKMLVTEISGFNPTPNLVDKILDNLHTQQGYELLTRWHLPAQYCDIAKEHHNEEYDSSDILLTIVRLVNMVCNKMEKNDPDQDLTFIIGSKEADILGISETGVALLEIALEDAQGKQ
ncbi:putative signal transduction protein [Desulforapulum autotrophicum HRM2]|uniref:Signal transduction protein n=1 Tax=Desulforapulum autotrophicum (strain ATCC 43914 / DSM 3382 / VKM B-1955 / HRM2) TaxID=177437 RepID=C0QHB3_DESAH|nr:HDOD domain-containing protein [Desulforapulum autotrophicum]ACN17772.1 putative signal transduction protein [Desulforapulum autotrophicum HRM2]